jgi:PIN domain nuclease of toxin-antitoxin system
MRLLLDTQSFIWFIEGNTKLSTLARMHIEDIANVRQLSIASLWEIAIKMSIGKLNLGLPFATLIPQQLDRNLVDLLDITVEHLAVVANLPFHHKDPFDRLIISQAIVEQMPIISVDSAFDAYGITRLW